MRRVLLLMTCVAACVSAVHVTAETMPSSSADTALLPLFSDLLRKARYGMTDQEVGGFVVEEDGEESLCLQWPTSSAYRKLTYRGPVPLHTRAIVHTHPFGLRKPSRDDLLQARRSGLPFYVVTRDSIWKAAPDGTITEVLRKQRWWADLPAAEPGCMGAGEFIAATVRRGGRPPEWRDSRWARSEEVD